MSLNDTLIEILRGEERQPDTSSAHSAPRLGWPVAEEGMISLVTIVVVAFLLVLISFVGNIGLAVTRKIETQNAADSATYSGAVWMARGMNAITAGNHLMGEVLCFVVIHHAIGGEELDEGERGKKDEVDSAAQSLEQAAMAAENAGAATGVFAYDTIDSMDDYDLEVTAGATVVEGKLRLIKALTVVYVVKAVAGALEQSGFYITVAIGYALEAVAVAAEVWILAEWLALSGLEALAKATVQLKKALFNVGLPAVSVYQGQAAIAAPALAIEAAETMARRHGMKGALYPGEGSLRLPVRLDPTSADDPESDEFKRSQVVRATYPWVRYHRQPLRKFMSWMIVSQAKRFYTDFSNEFTLTKSAELYEKNVRLYVMDGPFQELNKGSELWTRNSREADRRFCVVGFAHRDPPKWIASRMLDSPASKGIATYAQAMFYNANRQNPNGSPPQGIQPEIGWDTLNWFSPVERSYAHEHGEGIEDENRPRIRINWQAKLVPVTRLRDAVGNVGEPFDRILQPLVPEPDQFRTH